MNCRDCDRPFEARPGKPGFINQCEECAHDIPLLGGNMVWAHKTAPELEIKPMVDAKLFAARTRRHGAGVTASLTQPKLTPQESTAVGKRGSGAEDRAQYTSRLGEKRTVKS